MNADNQEIRPRVVGFAEGINDVNVATAFAKLQNLPQFKIVRGIPIKAIFALKPHQNARILDFGCGTGHFLIDLYNKSHKKGYKFLLYGLDIAQSMLEQCKSALNRKNVPNIKLILGDGASIPTQDHFFDIVSTNLSLHHWDNPVQILSEIYRVIRPHGYLFLFDLRRDAPQKWFKFLSFITRRIVPKPLRRVKEPLGSLLASYTREEIQNIIEDTPWNNAAIKCITKGPFMLYEIQKK
jgi:ubiquinone/menaquinone biosynthesis C-methylase UbiE